MGIDIISVFNPLEDVEVITNEDKIRSMTKEELAHLSVTPVVLSSGTNIWTMYRGAFSSIDYDSREEAECGELEWLQSPAGEIMFFNNGCKYDYNFSDR